MKDPLGRAGRWGRDAVFRKDGPLTRELTLQPSKFGLGRLPQRIAPDLTTTMVCGFCSTGCGLEVMLKDGQAVGLTPTADYPVNLGMACPKGWEALAVLNAPDRAEVALTRSGGQAASAFYVNKPINMETIPMMMWAQFMPIAPKTM